MKALIAILILLVAVPAIAQDTAELLEYRLKKAEEKTHEISEDVKKISAQVSQLSYTTTHIKNGMQDIKRDITSLDEKFDKLNISIEKMSTVQAVQSSKPIPWSEIIAGALLLLTGGTGLVVRNKLKKNGKPVPAEEPT